MLGKKKCKILKEIRQRIADENDIPYVTRECTYQGNCSGTCPKCEAELRYLEQQLSLRQRVGKIGAVSALSLGLTASMAGCDPFETVISGDMRPIETEAPEDYWAQLPKKGLLLEDPEDSDVQELQGYAVYVSDGDK